MWYSGKQQQEAQIQQAHTNDSLETKHRNDSLNALQQRLISTDTTKKGQLIRSGGSLETGIIGTEQLTVVENNLFKATFTNKGGRLKSVELKNYKTAGTNNNVVLSGGADDNMGYGINTGSGNTRSTSEFYFAPGKVGTAAGGAQTVSFTLADSTGQAITHQYIIKPNNYLIDWNIDLTGADKLLTQGAFNFQWQSHPQQHEKKCLL